MTFLDENEVYIDWVNDEINTTNANGKMISRPLMSVNQNEMNNTKNRFNKGKEKIIGYHLIQLFAKENNVIPERAHRIGLDYANEIFGEDFEIVVATH